MTKQITKIATILVLVIGLTAVAAKAQVDGGFAPVGFYTGVEATPGTCEATTATCFGNTYVLNSYGEWDIYVLTLSLNYVGTPNHNGNGMGVIGGTWSLVIFRENAYAGTLYGDVLDGAIYVDTDRNGDPVSKHVRAGLRSNGGLGEFSGKHGENITGIVNVVKDYGSGDTQGTANFSF